MNITQTSTPENKRTWLYDLLLVVVLLVAAYFRFVGADWGGFQNQHPDENFLSSVTLAIAPVGTSPNQLGAPPTAAMQNWRTNYPKSYPDCKAWGGYFDTNCSPLNPHNHGDSFYVYGDLPVIMTRYLAGWLGQMNHLTLFGRYLSGVMDLGTIVLLYFIVKRLYGRRVALLSAAFSAFAVEQIQQSHFYTTDNFAVFFMFLALYFAVLIATWKEEATPEGEEASSGTSFESKIGRTLLRFGRDPVTLLSLAFGVALGMAAASKLNAAALAVTLPVALLVRYFRVKPQAAMNGGQRRSAVEELIAKSFIFLVIGAIASVLAFRIFQPYAFNGLGLDPQWLANMRELRGQASPNADMPWSLQWARRSHLYSFQNLTEWGLGLPLGILAWAGFLWMGWRILKGEWRQHLLLWSWTAFYFIWQSLQYNPTMRYQLPIYPLLAMMAAWGLAKLVRISRDYAARHEKFIKRSTYHILHIVPIILGALVLLATAAWAFAFLHIYTSTEPRSAATEWIFQNIPGPINLDIKTPSGTNYQQPLSFSTGTLIQVGSSYQVAFNAQAEGTLDQILLPHVSVQVDLDVTLWQNPDDAQPLASGVLSTPGQIVSVSQVLHFDQPPALKAQQTYTLKVEMVNPSGQANLCRPLQLSEQTDSGEIKQPIDPATNCIVGVGQPYQTQFVPQADGTLAQIDFGHIADIVVPDRQTLNLTLASAPDVSPDQVLATVSVTADFEPRSDPRGDPFTLKLNQPVSIVKNQNYYLRIETSGSALTLAGASFANETDADYTLPFRTGGYDPFGGIYRGDLNLQVYWPDNTDKLTHFETDLGQADYLLLPTAHQYTQITRIPERYPLTTVYYRELLGCPPDKNIIWCYKVAQPGMFHGNLGFDLVAVFTSYPSIGPLQINDQSAEEAFWFYDHPKTMIFKKNADYDPSKVQAILGAVDTSSAIPLTPGQADTYKSLMLPADQLAAQQAGGTWSDLFNRDAFYNRYPGLGAVLWYLVIFILGLFTYPFVRAALPGLADHGYPLARIFGLLLWAWLAWMAGSIGLTYSKLTIGIALGLIMLIGVWQAWRQREELKQELKERWKYFLMVEIIFLSFFLIDLLIRLGNPDLWHPAKGGERPMDFAYLNAVLKSTSFPPYDPWFAGGYINYYYYGYVIVGTPVKLLGIVPSIAYNFILPTLFACLAMAAFSVGWNLLAGIRDLRAGNPEEPHPPSPELQGTHKASRFALFDSRFIAGLSAASAMVLLGNLGIVRMLYQGFQQIAAPGGLIDKANIFQRILWTIEGFFMALIGRMHLSFGPGDWYWFPSRALPDSSGGPITEFPLFTFIYSDLHAHMIALMITVLAIAWALSVLMAKARWKNHLDTAVGLFLGGLVIGAIKPTNTWDFYTYLILSAVVLAYTVWRYADISRFPLGLPEWGKRLALTAGAVVALVGGSLLFYQPYTHWYLLDSGYTKVYPWTGGRSNISSYLVHWGVFLFFIVSWMVWETRQWLAETPISALRKLRPYRDLIIAAVVILLVVLVAQQGWVMSSSQNVPWKGITIVWVALPLAAWAAVLLLFRPGISDVKRLVLFMVGTALLLTMVVEFMVLGGDIGRMNMVFKLYNQAWVMLGLSAAACFAWLLSEFRKWHPGWRVGWQVAATALTAGAALFLLMGGMGKIDDRMAASVPHTLDSMTYMNYATYYERNTNLDLSADYRAIRWMQDNVKGSPVIAEAPSAGIQYEWLNRFSIYTGLPDVVGWEWHQMQQRVIFTETVRDRGREEDNFYVTTDIQATLDFIHKYNVRYIIVGELEHAKYETAVNFNPGASACPNCLAKFETYNGKYWHSVYRDGQTVIYEVNP